VFCKNTSDIQIGLLLALLLTVISQHRIDGQYCAASLSLYYSQDVSCKVTTSV